MLQDRNDHDWSQDIRKCECNWAFKRVRVLATSKWRITYAFALKLQKDIYNNIADTFQTKAYLEVDCRYLRYICLSNQQDELKEKKPTVDILSKNTDNATHWLKQEFRVMSWRIVRITHSCVEEWHRCMEDIQNSIMMQVSWSEVWKDVSTNTPE